LLQYLGCPACVFCGGQSVLYVGTEMVWLVTGLRVEYGVVVVGDTMVLDDDSVLLPPPVELVTGAPKPTQYACLTQKLVWQSLDTAGFQDRNCSWVMPKLASTVPQVSPDCTRYQLLQFAGDPVNVGPGGEVILEGDVLGDGELEVLVGTEAPTPTQ
jgi:hypothetical protein